MSARPDGLDWFYRRGHTRLALLSVLGAAFGILGAAVWLTDRMLGHGLGTSGLRTATLGLIVFAFGTSGYVAFAVFERGVE